MTQAANLAALGTNAGTTGILPAAGGGTAGTGGAIAFKNRLINGNMNIDQRNNGNSVTASAVGGTNYTLDRWYYSCSQASKFTIQQNSGNAPLAQGFNQCLKITSLSAYSVTTNDYFRFGQIIEGWNVSDLGWGTASAKTVTLSFWTYSSLTGTFGGSVTNGSEDRCYPFSYTISSANTWTQISVTIPGCTDGTWNTITGWGVQLIFGLGAGTTYSGTAGAWTNSTKYTASGAVSVVGTSGATWYLVGAQLEVGTAATNYDSRSYTTELQLCQRYYQLVGGGTAQGGQSSTIIYWGCVLPVTMRANPSLGQTAVQYFYKPGVDVWNQSSTGLTGASSSLQGVYAGFTNISGVTTQAPYQWAVNYSGTPSYLTASAEL
jgi:hypothetical protein